MQVGDMGPGVASDTVEGLGAPLTAEIVAVRLSVFASACVLAFFEGFDDRPRGAWVLGWLTFT